MLGNMKLIKNLKKKIKKETATAIPNLERAVMPKPERRIKRGNY
jgi:hypothetical protein